MRYVKASMLTYDASVGRVEPGETYYVEDEKAERWINAGVASAGTAPPPQPPAPDPTPIPQPEPKPEEKDDNGDEDEDDKGEDDEELRAQVQKLSDEGDSQRIIGEKLNISRATVRRLLAA